PRDRPRPRRVQEVPPATDRPSCPPTARPDRPAPRAPPGSHHRRDSPERSKSVRQGGPRNRGSKYGPQPTLCVGINVSPRGSNNSLAMESDERLEPAPRKKREADGRADTELSMAAPLVKGVAKPRLLSLLLELRLPTQ